MISNAEKRMLHVYARAGRIPEAQYRGILRARAGVASAADPDMTHAGCDAALAALEAALWDRVQRGAVPDPRPHKYIRDPYHYRRRNPGRGMVNSRHMHKIRQLWALLQDYLPPDRRGADYLAGIVAHASGRPLCEMGLSALTAAEAHHTIEALKDRLHNAIGRGAA
jgi:hypothetical protein